ncbi:hypothetical protein SAMN04488020_10178 [Palleronia marisminoris]|uniref:Methyl-accepting transducer domain-containing protein n=1 Tax=Palleronia marisminoris TaxID=315423 RepID=A0A1Y5R7S9_9RHOB|nr:hypothetical protein [Palleronia marisminoris]SFG07290.1 hypothetical protein SAMN04488020_10178 [Palleronia marisminoris]SLN11127.1 hypothetical protein PAM7066_00080 [Palleronia marisminoris]
MTPPDVSPDQSLDRLSHEIAGAFSVAFFELETIRNVAAEFGSDVERLLAVVETGEEREKHDGNFDAFLVNASSAATAAESAAGSLTGQAFQGALIRISGSLIEMKKYTVALVNISSLTKITQTETLGVADQLLSFTQLLDSRCHKLQDATARSATLVVGTQRQSGLARDKLTSIGQEFRALSNGAGDEAERLAVLERDHRAYMENTRENSNRLGVGVSTAVGDLVGCLQFPDAFAQRVEHVRAALGAMDGAPPAECDLLATVASAQLAAMATSLTEVATTAATALIELRAAVEHSPITKTRSEAVNPSDLWMTATAQANQVMLASVGRAREQLGSALKVLSILTDQIDKTQSNLEAAVELNRELETSVHNASLVAHRSGSQTSPLRFLAGSVRDVVDRTSSLISEVSESLMHIRDTSQALSASSLRDDLETLLALQETSAKEAEEQGRRVNLVHDMRRQLLGHADRLGGAAGAAQNAFETAAAHGAALIDLSRRIAELSSGSAITDSDLDWLYATYTMEEERCVHREALGMPDPEEAEGGADDDLEDFML